MHIFEHTAQAIFDDMLEAQKGEKCRETAKESALMAIKHVRKFSTKRIKWQEISSNHLETNRDNFFNQVEEEVKAL